MGGQGEPERKIKQVAIRKTQILRLIYNIKIENKEDFYEKIGISFAGGSPYAASDS